MPHLKPDGTDWVNAAFIVHPKEPKVLLVQHKKLGTWLPVGGHIELDTIDKDPDAALTREVREETGLSLAPVGEAPGARGYDAHVFQTTDQLNFQIQCSILDPVENNRVELHWVPWALETHLFPPVPGHRHLCLVYLIFAHTDRVKLEAEAHDSIRWFNTADLCASTYKVRSKIQLYGHRAIRKRWSSDPSVTA